MHVLGVEKIIFEDMYAINFIHQSRKINKLTFLHRFG